MTRDYELGVIFNPEVNEEQTRPVYDRIEQIVANHSGQITRVNQWGRRRLAYPIDHHRDGLYVFIDMVLTPETVVEIERTLQVSEIVLRYMTQKRDAKAVQREREEREARAAAAAAAAANAAEQQQQQQPVEGEEAPLATEEQVPVVVAETPIVTPEEVVATPVDDVVTPEEVVTTPADDVVTPEEIVTIPAADVVTPEEVVTTPQSVETTETPAATNNAEQNEDTPSSEAPVEA